jgi:hypothetical protein
LWRHAARHSGEAVPAGTLVTAATLSRR